EVQERILQEATRLFAARGFEGTPLQAIADAVGIRKQSLLYYFPSKEDLRHAVLQKVLAHWNDVLPDLLLAASSSHGQFDGVLGEMVAFFSADPDRPRLLLREILDRPGQTRELMDRLVQPWVRVTCDYIRKGQEGGRLWDEVDPEAYVHQVINLLVASIATFEALGTTDRERNLVELARVAKSSLFRPED
ncbi:MAG: TetR/AcrR family transcriptional regulator, partial [Thermoanaerobaculia bacterium]